ncbi:hypothetical protein NKJ46_20230 [Mesorhizobium sp. M0166]|uniref:hypothetical protein n=1 Tax=Mesorhizobium sp. M0166 TaxID=2956902 RepID=UPI00333A6D26
MAASCVAIGLFDGGRADQKAAKIPVEGPQQRWNRYGCNRPYALVSVMRYVIVITTVTFFLIWDGIYNQGRYLDRTVREVTRIVHYVTSMV